MGDFNLFDGNLVTLRAEVSAGDLGGPSVGERPYHGGVARFVQEAMTIEIRRLLIKSSVLPEGSQEDTHTRNIEEGMDDILGYILEECRQMVAEMLRKDRER